MALICGLTFLQLSSKVAMKAMICSLVANRSTAENWRIKRSSSVSLSMSLPAVLYSR